MGFGLYTYPWNIHDADADVAAMRALGASRVVLAASYHAGKFIQPHDPVARVYYPEDGTVYFHPRRRDYGLLRPQVARAVQSRDVLAGLAARGDIGVTAWVVLNHNLRLGELHPDVVVRNAYGEPYPYSLCPAHFEVRHYATTLTADLAAAYPIDAMVIESPGFMGYAHGYHHEFALLPPDAWLDAMLGLCFCDACRSGADKAGIDADTLAARIRQRIDAFLAADTAPDPADAAARIEGDVASDPGLARFLRWRCALVTQLCAAIRAAVRADVRVRVIPTTRGDHAAAAWEGCDLTALDAATDGLEVPLYKPDADAVAAEARIVLDAVPADRVSAILRPGWPDMTSATQLRETVSRLRALGLGDLSFYNYGLLPQRNLAWLQRLGEPE